VIDIEDAKSAVLDALRDAEERGAPACVLYGEVRDYERWWVIGYQSEAFARHGDVMQMLAGNGPYVVPKDGSPIFTLSSAEAVEPQMTRLAATTSGDGR